MHPRIREVWASKSGKAGISVSGFSVFWQFVKWGLELAGLHQTMMALVPQWMLNPLFIPLLFAAGVLLMLYAVNEKRAKEKVAPAIKQGTKGSHSPAVSTYGDNSPVYLGTPSPASPPIPAESQSQNNAPSIMFVQAERKKYEGSGLALIATFKNVAKQTGQKTRTPQEVIARLSFRNDAKPSDGEVHINYGTWWGNSSHYVSFGAGQTRSLVIAVMKNRDVLALNNPNPSEFNPSYSHTRRAYRIPQEIRLPWDSGQVEITLVESKTTLYQAHFAYDMEHEQVHNLDAVPLHGENLPA